MAIGPTGTALGAPGVEELATLTPDQQAFARGMEGVVDRALRGWRPGESFVYGIYQEIDEPVRAFLVRRYADAGWSEVGIEPGLTGNHLLVLAG